MSRKSCSHSRRKILKGLSVCAAQVGLGCILGCTSEEGVTIQPGPVEPVKPKFLIVIGATGGASIIDSFLAIRESESSNAPKINCFPDSQVLDVNGSPFRSVKLDNFALSETLPLPISTDQSNFAKNHKDDMMVVTGTGTSVNHVIGQKRSVTGAGAWAGRTLAECVANHYGANFPLPNVNMGAMGFAQDGDDLSLPSHAYAEKIANPALWPLGLDGSRGIPNAPAKDLVAMARSVRDQKLDPSSIFHKTFARNSKLKRYLLQRNSQRNILEALDLITQLMILPHTPPFIDLIQYGLEESPDGQELLEVFPNLIPIPGYFDPMEAQAALAFLLIKNKLSCAVTMSSLFSLNLTPNGLSNLNLGFDFSHQGHRGGQAFMWDRTLSVIDRLIALLKSREFDTATGESFWDRTLIYVATDFGRGKNRINGEEQFSSAHNLNNGYLVISPMANGNKVLGGVNPDTGYTHGFDLDDPAGIPDPSKETSEKEVFAGLLGALGVDKTGSGLPDVRAMRKNA